MKKILKFKVVRNLDVLAVFMKKCLIVNYVVILSYVLMFRMLKVKVRLNLGNIFGRRENF